MTRLNELDMAHISSSWAIYNERLHRILGVDLLTLGALANGREPETVRAALFGRKVAAISISQGGGVVGGFAHSVATIATHMGLIAKVMPDCDEKGVAQAQAWGAEFLIYADDKRYVLENMRRQLIADNNQKTSQAFVAALKLMAGGSLFKQKVIVLGLGIIGQGAAEFLLQEGAQPYLYDIDGQKGEKAEKEIAGARVLASQEDLQKALKGTHLIFDATPNGSALAKQWWPQGAIVSAPGVPLSWPQQWLDEKGPPTLWHDPLQSGTAAMLAAIGT
ncbi:MAG: 3-methylornithyl-N6-L-lysine dehydrogenase PylD [Candidatus Adiutrix sp.]